MPVRVSHGPSQVAADGSLLNGAPFFRMETSPQNILDTALQIAVDNSGDMYRGTVLGIEMESASGRMDMILNPPKYGGIPGYVAFGGPERDWLYASEDGKLYRRQTKRKGFGRMGSCEAPTTVALMRGGRRTRICIRRLLFATMQQIGKELAHNIPSGVIRKTERATY